MTARLFRLAALLMAVWCWGVMGASGSPADDAWLAAQPRLYPGLDHAAVDSVLASVTRRFSSFPDRVRAIALLRLGTPYVLGCLGEEKGRDSKPLFRLDEADCTVFVLTTSALAHAGTWDGARAMMRVLNYYPRAGGADPVAYENRIHFTEDRLLTSPYFEDVTRRVAGAIPLQGVTLTLNRRLDGSRLLPIPWEKSVTVHYLPTAGVTPQVMAGLPAPVAGVAFVRRHQVKLGLVVAHEGLVIDRHDLIHADSVHKQVRRVDLCAYLQRNADWFDGVIFYALR